MDKNHIIETIKRAKEASPKRNFKQGIDLVLVLKGLDLKKSEHNVNSFVTLHYPTGKKFSVCALVGPELEAQAKEVCDEAITDADFDKFKGKKEAKKLANKHEFFIAQATIMPKIATAFGRVFGPKGKMPNPKAGCVVPPNANLKPLYERLQKTVKVRTINQPIIQVKVGVEDQKEEEIVDNILTIYNNVIHVLPNEKHNVKKALIKLTMGPSFKVGAKEKEEDKKKALKVEAKPEEKAEVKEEKPKEEPKKEEKKEVPKKEAQDKK